MWTLNGVRHDRKRFNCHRTRCVCTVHVRRTCGKPTTTTTTGSWKIRRHSRGSRSQTHLSKSAGTSRHKIVIRPIGALAMPYSGVLCSPEAVYCEYMLSDPLRNSLPRINCFQNLEGKTCSGIHVYMYACLNNIYLIP